MTTYPENPGFKVGGTSAIAAFEVKEDAKILREQCFQVLLRGEMTADEVAFMLDKSVLSIRPRISELVAAGRVFKTGQRRKNESGHSAEVMTTKQHVIF